MTKYLLKRIFYMLLTLFIVATATFFLMKAMPGSPYANEAKMTLTQRHIMDEQYGLNKPVIVQYLIYLKGIFTGDFGTSFQYANQSVSSLIMPRLAVSMQLGLQAMILGVVLGALLGTIAAIRQGTWVDSTSTVIAIIGRSIPNFVFSHCIHNQEAEGDARCCSVLNP